MNNPTPDAHIPILTEVISAAPAIAPQPEAEHDEEFEEAPHLVWSEKNLRLLEDTLNERVLRQVQSRIDFILEHRIRDSLADAMQTSLEGLTAEIKRGLHQTLEDVISRAISQELARLQTLKE